MGSLRREYGILDFDLNMKTRSVKEELKYLPVDKSCRLAMKITNLAFYQLKSTITKRKKINRKFFTQELYNLLDKYIECDAWELPDNLSGEITFATAPEITGGDNYNLYNHKNQAIYFDVIEILVGINYKSYNSCYVRTLLINPTENIKDNYNFMTSVKRIILYYLRDGVELGEVYQHVVSFVRNEKPHLTKYLHRNFGCLINPMDESVIIKLGSKSIAEYGMTFLINVNLNRLTEEKSFYDLGIMETVLVRKNEPAELLTYSREAELDTAIQIDNENEPKDYSSGHNTIGLSIASSLNLFQANVIYYSIISVFGCYLSSLVFKKLILRIKKNF